MNLAVLANAWVESPSIYTATGHVTVVKRIGGPKRCHHFSVVENCIVPFFTCIGCVYHIAGTIFLYGSKLQPVFVQNGLRAVAGSVATGSLASL